MLGVYGALLLSCTSAVAPSSADGAGAPAEMGVAGSAGSVASMGGSSAGTSAMAGSGGSGLAGNAGNAGNAGTGGSAGSAGSSGSGGSAGGPAQCDPVVNASPASSRHTARPLGSTAAAEGFYEYLPPGYGDHCPRPLLIFFPGSGELGNGTDQLDRLLAHGPPKLISRDEWPNERPFIVLSVQHAQGCRSAEDVDAFLTFALAKYDIDPNRVYLTGLSCGGFRSWDYIGKHPGGRVAAIVPIAGDGQDAWTAIGCALGQQAIWAFHGDADPTVPIAGSLVPTTNLMACPMPPRKEIKMTSYPGVVHDSWTRTYDLSAGNDPFTWLLGITK